MAQYQMPQFIEIEEKIIGPLSLKQFLYLAGGGSIVFVSYFFLSFSFFVIFSILILAFSAALAFIKINGQPFSVFLKNFFVFIFKQKIYIWKSEEKK